MHQFEVQDIAHTKIKLPKMKKNMTDKEGMCIIHIIAIDPAYTKPQSFNIIPDIKKWYWQKEIRYTKTIQTKSLKVTV